MGGRKVKKVKRDRQLEAYLKEKKRRKRAIAIAMAQYPQPRITKRTEWDDHDIVNINRRDWDNNDIVNINRRGCWVKVWVLIPDEPKGEKK
jgi:hypothetical protein